MRWPGKENTGMRSEQYTPAAELDYQRAGWNFGDDLRRILRKQLNFVICEVIFVEVCDLGKTARLAT